MTGSQAGASSEPPSRPPRKTKDQGVSIWLDIILVLVTVSPVLFYLPVISHPFISAFTIIYILWCIFGFL